MEDPFRWKLLFKALILPPAAPLLIALIGLARCFRDAVGVIEHHAEIADAADAGLRAHRRLAGLDARITEDALLRLSG